MLWGQLGPQDAKKIPHATRKIPRATSETQCSQISNTQNEIESRGKYLTLRSKGHRI